MKRITIAILAAAALAVGMLSGQQAAAHAGVTVASHGSARLVLDTSGPHKTGRIMVNGHLKLATAYLVRLYDGGRNGTWCIDNTGNGQANGTKEQLWTCNFRDQQYWYYIPSSYGGGWSELKNYGNGKCLDDTGHGGDGTQFQTWDCLGDQDQAVSATSPGGGASYDIILSAVTIVVNGFDVNLAVDNTLGHLLDGNKIQAWAQNGGANQRWCQAWSSC